LIVGGRYGSVPSGSGKSITNLEYLTAKAHGLPVFAFVHRDVLAVLPVWEQNPTADFSKVVDTTALFEFIQQVRSEDRVWTFAFDTAQDIISTLRIQLAYQMSRGLNLLRRMRTTPEIDGLTGESFRLAVEHGDGWPAKLLASLIRSEVAAAADLRRDHAAGIALGAGEQVHDGTVSKWVSFCTDQALRIIAALQIIIDQTMNEAVNTADISAIRHAARQIGQAYRDCLGWAARLRRAGVPDEWRTMIHEQSFMLDNVLSSIEQLAAQLEAGIEAALAQPGEGPHSLDLTVRITLANEDRVHVALEELRRSRPR
jgi:hypothetical protein